MAHQGSRDAAEGDLRHLDVELWGLAAFLQLEAGLPVDTTEDREGHLAQGKDEPCQVVRCVLLGRIAVDICRIEIPVDSHLCLRQAPIEEPLLVAHRVIRHETVAHADQRERHEHAPLQLGLLHAAKQPTGCRSSQQSRLRDHAVGRRVDAGHGQHLADVGQRPADAGGCKPDYGSLVETLPHGLLAAKHEAQKQAHGRDERPRGHDHRALLEGPALDRHSIRSGAILADDLRPGDRERAGGVGADDKHQDHHLQQDAEVGLQPVPDLRKTPLEVRLEVRAQHPELPRARRPMHLRPGGAPVHVRGRSSAELGERLLISP
mmetsp:Transcript_19363/g.58259  ORF Transcript_19363/g.58259 Transcript_19363/m.58259 type:complete len:320 (+) Transcript_19363:427-1386(+)